MSLFFKKYKLSIRASRWFFSSILLFVILIQTNVSSLQEDNLILKVSSEGSYKYIILGAGLLFYFFYERFRGKDDKPNPNANSSDSLEEPLFVEDAVNNISSGENVLVGLVEGTQEVLGTVIESVISAAIIGAGIINAIPMIEEVPLLLQPVPEVLQLSSLQISSMIYDICQKTALDPDYPKRWYESNVTKKHEEIYLYFYNKVALFKMLYSITHWKRSKSFISFA